MGNENVKTTFQKPFIGVANDLKGGNLTNYITDAEDAVVIESKPLGTRTRAVRFTGRDWLWVLSKSWPVAAVVLGVGIFIRAVVAFKIWFWGFVNGAGSVGSLATSPVAIFIGVALLYVAGSVIYSSAQIRRTRKPQYTDSDWGSAGDWQQSGTIRNQQSGTTIINNYYMGGKNPEQ